METTANNNRLKEAELPFTRYYFRHSMPFLFFIGLAILYCLGYGVLLFREFSRMGVINMILQGK